MDAGAEALAKIVVAAVMVLWILWMMRPSQWRK